MVDLQDFHCPYTAVITNVTIKRFLSSLNWCSMLVIWCSFVNPQTAGRFVGELSMQPRELESYLKWLLDSWFECLNQLTHLAIFSSEMKWSHTISGFWILLINLLYSSYPIVIVQKIKCNYLFKLFRWVK